MSAPRIYLDTNVFIAAYENRHARSEHAWQILSAIDDGELVGVTSELTLAEFLVRPLQEQDYDRAKHYQEIIAPGAGFDVPTVDRAVLLEAEPCGRSENPCVCLTPSMSQRLALASALIS